MVRVLAFVTATLALVTSAPCTKLMLGVEAVLNSKPSGTLRISVPLLTLLPRSCFFPSAIVIGPRVVQAGDVPLAAVSAEMAPPPEAGVMTTDASALATNMSATNGATRAFFVFIRQIRQKRVGPRAGAHRTHSLI